MNINLRIIRLFNIAALSTVLAATGCVSEMPQKETPALRQKRQAADSETLLAQGFEIVSFKDRVEPDDFLEIYGSTTYILRRHPPDDKFFQGILNDYGEIVGLIVLEPEGVEPSLKPPQQ